MLPLRETARPWKGATVKPSEYVELDAVGLAGLIRDREVSTAEVLDAAIRQIEVVNPSINAVIHKTYDRARDAAANGLTGPLAGVPLLVKDLGQVVEGAPATMGSRMLAHQIADHDSALVARYRQAGVLVIGLTNVPEFGIAAVTEPDLFGPTRNPWNTSRTPGGSSGGAGAAVAARMVPAAHGSDGGGSIRIPASMCGVFGLKPTRARTPKGPDIGEGWFGLSVDHALTMSVRDSAALLDIGRGPDPGAPYYPPPPSRLYLDELDQPTTPLRIAVSRGAMLGTSVDPVCVSAVDRAAVLLESLGHHVVYASPAVDADELAFHFMVLLCAATAHGVTEAAESAGRSAGPEFFENLTWIAAAAGRRLSAEDLAAALDYTRMVARRTATFWDEIDVFVESTVARPAWKIGELTPSPAQLRQLELLKKLPSRTVTRRIARDMGRTSLEAIPNTPLWNVTGQPSMSVPLHWHDDLPIGVQFTARYADEATLFRLAAQLEQAQPWKHRVPQVVQEIL